MRDIVPFVRILMYLIAGSLATLNVDPALVEFVRDDAELLGSVVALVTFVWWRIAKRLGHAT